MRIDRRTFLKRAGATGLLAGLTGTGYSTLIEPHHLSLERITVKIPRLPTALEGFRIAMLSDFHLEPITTLHFIKRALKLANDLKPDLVVLLGDYVTTRAETIRDLAPEFAKMKSRHGVFAVLGNHDHWLDAPLVGGELKRQGIELLSNRGVEISTGGNSFFLAGIDSAFGGKPNIHAALANRRTRTPTIALVHEPDFADDIAGLGQFDLQLSGHSHGGQIRLPLIGALKLPTWGQRYDLGMYHIQDLTLYTSRGIGVIDYPVRFNCPPEVTEITLSAA